MAAKIPGIIPPRNYEAIRDRIGLVLLEELMQQYNLTGEDALNVTRVYLERFKPFDAATENPMINVSMWKGDYGNKSQRSVDGTYYYAIDIYTSGSDSQNEDGDTRSTLDLQRLTGVCVEILENPIYVRLDFINPGMTGYSPGAPTVSDRMVTAIHFPGPETPGSTDNTNRGRIILKVVSAETHNLITPSPLSLNTTTVRLYDTEQGYYWQSE